MEPNSCKMRGLTVHELKYSTPTNTFGFAARRQNLDSDVSNFKISICKLTGLPLCSMQYNPKRRLKAVATATVRTTIAVKSDPVICSLGHKPIYLYKTQNIHRHVVCLVNLAASNTYSALPSWQRICLPVAVSRNRPATDIPHTCAKDRVDCQHHSAHPGFEPRTGNLLCRDNHGFPQPLSTNTYSHKSRHNTRK